MTELVLKKGRLKTANRDPKWWTLNYGKTSVRIVRPKPGQSFDDALNELLDAMPRKPFKFLAMVKEAEKRRAAMALVEKKKASARKRYLKRMNRSTDSAIQGEG